MVNAETKLKIYMLITSRYKKIISEKEEKTIAEIRARCSPHQEFVRNLKEKIIPSKTSQSFLSQVEIILSYAHSIENFELLLTFWMEFQEIDTIKAAHPMDKAVLLTALLRSLDCDTAFVYVTKNSKPYVGFETGNKRYIITVENGSLLSWNDAQVFFQSDPIAYRFNDLSYESYDL